MQTIVLLFFFIALFGIFTVLVAYPLMVWLYALFSSRRKPSRMPHYRVSLIVVIHNGIDLIVPKLRNSLSLDYPNTLLEIIFFSDGSTDGTTERLAAIDHENVRTLIDVTHHGKFYGLNRAVEAASGDILVFSDADAMLATDALTNLMPHFSDDRVAGVCGRRQVAERNKPLSLAQRLYVALDNRLKQWESRVGRVTANDGKLYAIRRSLFEPVPPGVTDDLFTALSIIRQGHDFVYEPNAVAVVKLPSRNTHHELTRRRRIVSTSLNGIYHHRELLNPSTYGFFSVRLLVNKVMRRLLPFFLLFLWPSSLILYGEDPIFTLLFWTQSLFYVAAMSYAFIPNHYQGVVYTKISSTAYYICIGMIGTLMGWIDIVFR